MTKADKIRNFYDKYASGKMSIIEVSALSGAKISYTRSVLSRERGLRQVKISETKSEPVLDAPKFWNPEDELLKNVKIVK